MVHLRGPERGTGHLPDGRILNDTALDGNEPCDHFHRGVVSGWEVPRTPNLNPAT
jgi:hypothetical protein